MLKNLSTIILTIELWFLVLPITFLFLLGAYPLIKIVFIYQTIGNISISIIGLVSGLSLYSLWQVSCKILYSQNKKLDNKVLFWTLIILGGVIALVSLISNYIPIVEDYTPMYFFRSDLNNFVIGLPLVFIAIHLYFLSKKC